jgi:hypothetical protein
MRRPGIADNGLTAPVGAGLDQMGGGSCRSRREPSWRRSEFLGFPLVELVENGDYPGSSHFFFNIGNRNLLG